MGRAVDRQVTFAEAELKARVVLDRTLRVVSDLLDREQGLVRKVYEDLVRGLKQPKTGRDGMNPERVLRSFILSRVKDWDLRELRERIADGFSLRLFTKFLAGHVPSHQTFNRAFNRLTPDTLHALNQAVVKAALALNVEDGKKLRIDTTVVETNIHYPTDCTLLWDTVRVISRGMRSLREELPDSGFIFHDRTRRARRRSQEISRLTPTTRKRRQKRKYRDLIGVTEEVMSWARSVANQARAIQGLPLMKHALVQGLAQELDDFCDLGLRVVDQTRRRVLQGEQVPVGEKIFSIFEPHTDLIIRGKARKPVEFGHKVLIVETGKGLISDYRVLEGNPSDEGYVVSSLDQHQQLFDAAPKIYAADRGFYSQDNKDACQNAGVTVVSIPQRGGKKTPELEAQEKSPAFKKAQRFRAGVEGRISVLFRGRRMKRCLSEGRERFEVFVGAAILANNLLVLATLLLKKDRTRHRPAA